jgi:branched-chain amino acid transport system permease protein
MQQAQAGMNELRTRLDAVRIANRPLSWYFAGWRGLILAVLAAVLLPILDPDQSLISNSIQIGVYVMLALGLNIVVGFAGLLDLGYVAFFAIGSYTYAALNDGFLYNSQKQIVNIPSYTFWELLPVALVIAAVFGVLLGAPTLRLRGDYLAIVTLGFGEIVRLFFQNVPWFGAVNGLQPSPIPAVNFPIIGLVDFGSYVDSTPFYYLTVALVVIVAIVVFAMRDSSVGRAWIAIREDETAAASSGVNLVRTKLMAFAMGAAVASVGGMLSVASTPTVDPSQFVFNVSITILVMVVLGGIGSIPGVILGAIALKYVDNVFLTNLNQYVQNLPGTQGAGAPLHWLAAIDFNQEKYLLYGIVLLVMVLLRPQGIIPERRRSRELRAALAAEDVSSVGLLELEHEGAMVSGEGSEDRTMYAGPGSDAAGRGE